MSFCQRFGSSLNLNIHWHVIVPDAVFLPDASGERVDALKHRAPTGLDLEEIVTTVAIRAIRWLERHGYLRSGGDEDLTENADTASPWMRCLQGSLGVGELQRWAEHRSAEQSRDPARTRSLPKPTRGLSAEHLKFNLHAGVSVPGGLPAARERLLRYGARPPLALERLSVLDEGKICYRIKDTDHMRLMTPVQFLTRLAALVPPPRHPLVRFYGVWAPHSQWRSRVVTAATAKKTRITCASSTATDPPATPVTPAGPGIDASGTAASTPTPDGAQATSVPHPSRPKPQFPSAAALPSRRGGAAHPVAPQVRNCGSADSLDWPGLRSISESSTSTRSTARAAADGCASSK